MWFLMLMSQSTVSAQLQWCDDKLGDWLFYIEGRTYFAILLFLMFINKLLIWLICHLGSMYEINSNSLKVL